jgi:hypothetical protein
MICFKKGSATIEVDSTNIKNVNFGFDLQFELMDDSVYYCSLPELNIHFYTEDETKINLLASQHVESFFKFWLLSKSFNDFLNPDRVVVGTYDSRLGRSVGRNPKKSKSSGTSSTSPVFSKNVFNSLRERNRFPT